MAQHFCCSRDAIILWEVSELKLGDEVDHVPMPAACVAERLTLVGHDRERRIAVVVKRTARDVLRTAALDFDETIDRFGDRVCGADAVEIDVAVVVVHNSPRDRCE